MKKKWIKEMGIKNNWPKPFGFTKAAEIGAFETKIILFGLKRKL